MQADTPLPNANRILITGGAGFLGRAILRKAERENWRARITIYSRDEHKQAAVARRWPDVRCVLGDRRDLDRLTAAAAGHDAIIDAGAIKYIPEAERNVFETVDVNVAGSAAVVKAALRAGVEVVVGLSTDKAAEPLNTYGMTKGIMERLFAEGNVLADRAGLPTRFVCVRYGNVVSSSGSVVPLFRRQAETTGQITITDPDMTRFWLSNDEAVELISFAHAAAQNYPGAVFAMLCGAMKITDLAILAGEMSDRGGAELVTVGLRPGEKLHETLVTEAEGARSRIAYFEPSAGAELLKCRVIFPPTYNEGVPLGERIGAYRSDAPMRWITGREMAAMIEDAVALESEA